MPGRGGRTRPWKNIWGTRWTIPRHQQQAQFSGDLWLARPSSTHCPLNPNLQHVLLATHLREHLGRGPGASVSTLTHQPQEPQTSKYSKEVCQGIYLSRGTLSASKKNSELLWWSKDPDFSWTLPTSCSEKYGENQLPHRNVQWDQREVPLKSERTIMPLSFRVCLSMLPLLCFLPQ